MEDFQILEKVFMPSSEGLIFKTSSLIISISFSKFSFNKFDNLLSFSITIIFLGFLFNIALVKFPVPGPISKIFLSLMLTILTILSIIFWSIKKF